MSAPSRPRPRGRKRGVALLLIAALVVAGTVAASDLLPSLELDQPAPEPVAGATSGTAYCPVVVAQDETSRLEIASASLEEDTEVVVTTYVDGEPVTAEPRLLAAGSTALLEIPPEQRTSPVQVDWRGGPVVAQYRIFDPVESAVAGCETTPSDRWHLAGFDTNRGNRSLLYLFNPFGQDAIVRLTFGTTEGPVDLVIADEIQVPAGRVEVRDLADYRPETDDLAVTVTAQVGRVVPQGQMTLGPAGEGLEAVTGRALVSAAPVTSEQIFIPDALVDEVTSSWLTLYNPDERAAAVQLQVTTPLGTAVELAGETTVPAGGTTRVDLAELSALPRLGVRIDSINGIGLVASRTSAVQDGDRTGVAITGGVDMTDEMWTVPGARGPDGLVTLYNPGTEVATAQVEVAGGQPETWTAVNVPPNAVTSLPMSGLDPQGPAIVTADVPVVAGVVSLSPATATAFWSSAGVPDSALVGDGEVLGAQRDPRLATTPALSATATPTPEVVSDDQDGEGQLDPEPSIVPTSTATPTPSPGVTPPPAEAPTDETPATSGDDEPAPAPTGSPDAAPGPSPLPSATEGGSIFGKRQRVPRRRRDRHRSPSR